MVDFAADDGDDHHQLLMMVHHHQLWWWSSFTISAAGQGSALSKACNPYLEPFFCNTKVHQWWWEWLWECWWEWRWEWRWEWLWWWWCWWWSLAWAIRQAQKFDLSVAGLVGCPGITPDYTAFDLYNLQFYVLAAICICVLLPFSENRQCIWFTLESFWFHAPSVFRVSVISGS